tara:strand:+ start:96 stop:851 length:756 start_codon:yes stop_codon:yes gene_type:complete
MAVTCDKLIYTPTDALSFSITGGTKILTPQTDNGKIISLESPTSSIELGLTLEIQKQKYKVNIIEQKVINGKTMYLLSTAKKTKSSTFLFPILGGTRSNFFWDRLFMNCFIATEKDSHCIALLYRWSGDPMFIQFEKTLSEFPNFRKTYDPDTQTVMFVFDIPTEYEEDYTQYLRGGYSKLTTGYKQEVLNFHGLTRHSEIGQILYKDSKRRERLSFKLGVKLHENAELLSIINFEDETFNPEIYKCHKSL